MRVLVTGAGFIGSAVCRHLVASRGLSVINVDKLTYAANPRSLDPIAKDPRYAFERIDICNRAALDVVFAKYQPTAVLHLAAESHVDGSITSAATFIDTNVQGAFQLHEAARRYHACLVPEPRWKFRFVHVSTDEVYGSLGADGLFQEESPYQPNSPCSASKAASDHLALAWHRTYGLPVIISNCSNNCGPYQFPEKLIPLAILNALEGKPVPLYGDGANVRDWLYVDDHVDGLIGLLERGPGEKYNFGGDSERSDLAVVETGLRHCRLIAAARVGAALPDHVRCRPPRPRPALRHRRLEGAPRSRSASAAKLRDRARTYGALVSRSPGLVGNSAPKRLRRRAPRPASR